MPERPAAFAQSGGKVVTLTYWAGFTGGDKPTYVALVKLFNSTHPDIKVDMTIEPWDTIVPKVARRQWASGAVPDIATPDYNVGTIREYIKARLGRNRSTRCLVTGLTRCRPASYRPPSSQRSP